MNSSDLSLSCRSSSNKACISKTISEFVAEVSLMSDASERRAKLEDYVNRLQDEINKIDAFKRELPLCMLLLEDAILVVKEELTRCRKSMAEPVLEEFIPLKKEDDEKVEAAKAKDVSSREKINWMSSVQLWNSGVQQHQYPDIDLEKDKETLKLDIKKRGQEENSGASMKDLFGSNKSKIVGKAFLPFQGCTNSPVMMMGKKANVESPGGLSLLGPGLKTSGEDIGSRALSSKTSSSRSGPSSDQSNLTSGQQQQSFRKQRRCWSPELHRRFVNALQHLGGAQAATPKQIRELMQVDGLTNDEVKSHLQKYRLHTRRVPPTTSSSPNQQVGLLGGLWASQEQCSESSKQSNSQSGSPQGPLHLAGGSSHATSTTAGESTGDEDDEKSESHSWKSQIQLSRKDNV